MRKLSLDAVAREQMRHAKENGSGRAAKTVYGGHEHVLRQSVIALADGAVLADHLSPGEATIYVLSGRVRLMSGKDHWDCRVGDLLDVPENRQSVLALEPSVVLLTVAKP